jgi:hypothetical protein
MEWINNLVGPVAYWAIIIFVIYMVAKAVLRK